MVSAFEHHMQDLKLQWQEQTEEYYDGLLGRWRKN